MSDQYLQTLQRAVGNLHFLTDLDFGIDRYDLVRFHPPAQTVDCSYVDRCQTISKLDKAAHPRRVLDRPTSGCVVELRKEIAREQRFDKPTGTPCR